MTDLSLRKQISSICQTSFYHVRHLRQIRSSIDINSATVLANALIHSKLDYCNSLYYDLPNSLLHRLQLVQNSLARVVILSIFRSKLKTLLLPLAEINHLFTAQMYGCWIGL